LSEFSNLEDYYSSTYFFPAIYPMELIHISENSIENKKSCLKKAASY
jgi:hypothetical protein